MQNESRYAPCGAPGRAMGRTWWRIMGGGGGQVALLGYLGLCLNVLGLGYLFAADAPQYRMLTQEDRVVENLTAVWLGLAGLVLLFAAGRERGLGRRGVYVLGGLALVFGAGEEISWGQRLFGFATPGFLQAVNYQDEFNVHNIVIGAQDWNRRAVWYATLLLCTATGAAFLCRKDTLCGLPLPSMPLLLGFLVMLAYYTTSQSGFILDPNFLFMRGKHLLLLLACYTLFARQPGWFMLIATTVVLVLAVSYVNRYNSRAIDLNAMVEVQEYLFGFLCLGYALELGLGPGGRNTAPAGLAWRTVCAGVVVASVGLMGFQYVRIRTEAAFIERTYQALAAQEPVVRAAFAVYLRKNRLTYFKEPCVPADTEAPFILHLVPADLDSLPRARRAYGFDNRDFYFQGAGGVHADGKCFVIIPLPKYDIVRMRVGQRLPAEQRALWQAEFAVRQTAAAFIEKTSQVLAAQVPVVRAAFAVYLRDNRLIYFKEPCAPADTEAPFVLHLVPADPDSLPKARRAYGFDNRDFRFREAGGMHADGQCLVIIPLPKYEIVRMRVGQWLPAEQRALWQAEFAVRE